MACCFTSDMLSFGNVLITQVSKEIKYIGIGWHSRWNTMPMFSSGNVGHVLVIIDCNAVCRAV